MGSADAGAARTIDVIIVKPAQGGFSGKTLRVEAFVTSTFDIHEVIAEVEGESVELTFSSGLFAGNLDLGPLPQGPKTLSVTAEDVFGDRTTETRPFVYDTKPVLEVIRPVPDGVATPEIVIEATCADEGSAGCDLVVDLFRDGYYQETLASGTGSVLTTADLTAYDGKEMELRFRATDSAGQITREERCLFVEASPLLTVQHRLPGAVSDFDGQRLLFVSPEERGDRLLYFEYSDFASEVRDEVEVPVALGRRVRPHLSYLTPTGVVYTSRDLEGDSARITDWRNGELVDLGSPNSESSLDVVGDWAIWSVGTDLMLRRFSTGENELVAQNAGNGINSLSAQGDVAYWSPNPEFEVYLYRDGQTQQLTNGVLWSTYTATDGEHVLYRKTTECCQNQLFSLWMYADGVETMLEDFGLIGIGPWWDYHVTDGWIAHTRLGTLDQRHVWRIDPQGASTQVTFFGDSAYLEQLASNGEITLQHDGRRYLADTSGILVDIGWYRGRPFHADGQWFVAIDNTLFRVDI